jgi:hypothetical protein
VYFIYIIPPICKFGKAYIKKMPPRFHGNRCIFKRIVI